MQVDRETGPMDLRLRKMIVWSCLVWGGGNVNDKCDGQVVGYGEVGAGDIVDVKASVANQV